MGDADVLVVGAGPTGLVLALWLARLGVRLRLIDRSEAPAPFSRALGVQARTLELYRQLGIADDVVRAGVVADSISLWNAGRRTARVTFSVAGAGLTPYPFVLAYAQDAHERFLIAHLERAGVVVEWGTELLGLRDDGDAVTAALRRADGTADACRCAFLAGCDGARSAVRAAIGSGFPGGTYEHLFYVADIAARGPAVDDGVHVDLGGSELLAVFDMAGAGRVRLVGTVRPEAERASSGAITFEDVSQRPIESLHLIVDRVNWFSTYRVHHRVASRFRVGRTFLLGDAAHVHSPVGAQGMNTGIGDAVNLAWKLAAVIRDGADPRLLDTYETERIAFARALVATTDRAFALATAPGRFAALARQHVLPAAARALFGSARFRTLLFRRVSQLLIHYRASAISVGRAGGLRAGDRLPWLGGAVDNFAPLASLRWQAHVYGDAPGDLRGACDALGIALRTFPWTRDMRASGVARGALYLVRPDGYIGLADEQCRAEALRAYAARHLGRGAVLGTAAQAPAPR